MGLVSLFLKGKMLQTLIGAARRGTQTGRARGRRLKGSAGKVVMAAIAAMLVKRALRRR
jgi:hypothetical protein